MKRSVLAPIIGGAILGTIVFFTGPLLFFFLFAVLTLKFIFTPFGMGRMMMMRRMHHEFGHPAMAFAEKVRHMNEEEYAAFKSRMENHASRRHHCC